MFHWDTGRKRGIFAKDTQVHADFCVWFLKDGDGCQLYVLAVQTLSGGGWARGLAISLT